MDNILKEYENKTLSGEFEYQKHKNINSEVNEKYMYGINKIITKVDCIDNVQK